MAFLRKIIDKATLVLASTIWNGLTVYLATGEIQLTAPQLTLMVVIGNALIIWLGAESNNSSTPDVQVTEQPAAKEAAA